MKILDFPELRQTYEFDCGAMALEAVLAYYGIEKSEESILALAGTNRAEGTLVANMLHVLERHGLKSDGRAMTSKDLREYIAGNMPVILLLQAWGDRKAYATDDHDGHWVVAIGFDADRIIFEDPYAFKRVFLQEKELEDRWHAKQEGKRVVRYGIAVCGKLPTYDSSEIVHMG